MSIAPIQFLKVDGRANLYAGLDNPLDKYLHIAGFDGTTGTTPSFTDIFAKGCILIHMTDGTLYVNTATSGLAPTWNGPFTGTIPALADGDIFVGNAGNTAVAVTPSGDVTMTNTGVFAIAAGVIVNADINAAAAIAFSKLAALPSGDILVGSAGNVATAVAASGNATISNTGVVTVTGATGNFTIGGKLIGSGITATSGPGAVAVTGTLHQITTTGTGDALTLANGTAGQRLTIIYVAEAAGGDTAVLTPTTLAGGNTITFNALGDTAELVYSATGGWYMLGGSAVIA